jgi:hypothetical protein
VLRSFPNQRKTRALGGQIIGPCCERGEQRSQCEKQRNRAQVWTSKHFFEIRSRREVYPNAAREAVPSGTLAKA